MKFGTKKLALSNILNTFSTVQQQLGEFIAQEMLTVDVESTQIEKLQYSVDNRLDEIRQAQATSNNISKLLGKGEDE